MHLGEHSTQELWYSCNPGVAMCHRRIVRSSIREEFYLGKARETPFFEYLFVLRTTVEESRMDAESVVKSSMEEVPKAVAAGIVDMSSGMMLAIKTVESHPQSVLDVLAPATRELFEGDMVVHIEDLFKKSRGVTSDERYFQEILISSSHLWHYFGRLKSNNTVVICVVTRSDVNLGMLLVKARQLRDTAVI